MASLRRYVRAHFPGEVRAGQVRLPRPPVPPGAEAQVDYGYLGLWPDPATGRRRRVWAFSMVLPYSRHLFVRPVVSMTQRAWTEAHVAAFEFFGGVPAKLTPDNLKAGVCKPDLYDPKINRAYAELARHYGCLVDPARAYHPRDKAVIEAHQRYIRSSFFAGRSWRPLAAMTADAEDWCTAGGRAAAAAAAGGPHRGGGVRRRGGARAGAAAGGAVRAGHLEPAQGRPGRARAGGPHLVLGAVAADRQAAGRPGRRRLVEFYLDGELVKTHPFAPRGRRTDWADLPEHKSGFFMRTPVWCQAQAGMVGPACAALVGELLSVNALFRLRQAQGVLRLGQRHGDGRLEAACARALEAGDPSYRTVKGILAAGVLQVFCLCFGRLGACRTGPRACWSGLGPWSALFPGCCRSG